MARNSSGIPGHLPICCSYLIREKLKLILITIIVDITINSIVKNCCINRSYNNELQSKEPEKVPSSKFCILFS